MKLSPWRRQYGFILSGCPESARILAETVGVCRNLCRDQRSRREQAPSAQYPRCEYDGFFGAGAVWRVCVCPALSLLHVSEIFRARAIRGARWNTGVGARLKDVWRSPFMSFIYRQHSHTQESMRCSSALREEFARIGRFSPVKFLRHISPL